MARKNLIKLRKSLKLTQEQVAKEIEISRQHYGRIEEGERNPSYPLSIKIKDFFKYEKDDIFFNNECDNLVQSKITKPA